jgi:hypothetical protein
MTFLDMPKSSKSHRCHRQQQQQQQSITAAYAPPTAASPDRTRCNIQNHTDRFLTVQ